jgi:ribonucleoside-triphosphate reductase (thioredoxin)
MVIKPDFTEFVLSDNFMSKYKWKKPPFGFNGLGELVYMRTYSRIKSDGKNERWWETVQRVVEGTYNIQKDWIETHRLGWNPWQAQRSAQEMYDRMFSMKILPPGRGLWANGTEIITKKKLTPALFNCNFISTHDISDRPSFPFIFAMDMLMCGVGVGFDTKGEGTVTVKPQSSNEFHFIIPDSREGWVESLGYVIDSFFGNSQKPIFDYSLIREEGAVIKTFGGTASGYKPLESLHKKTTEILDSNVGAPITTRTIVDMYNLIGKAVVAGNVRRSALLAAGSNSDEFLNLKDYKKNPEREDFGWASNNSVLATLGMDYTDIAERIKTNGEPGLIWLENAHNNKRMGDITNGVSDDRTMGTNPCGEIVLESGEKCNLVEVFPNNHESKEDFIKSLKYAYLYSKTVTLLDTHWPETNRVMLRNRRVGTSVSGVAQFLTNNSLSTLRDWLRSGYKALKEYDNTYSDWFAIPKSIRITTNKPSGTISLLAGATPGIHFPESRFYIRRIRLGKDSALLQPLKDAGYKLEVAVGQEDSTLVVEVPVDVGEGIREVKNISMWEQLELASFMAEHWADNAVSVTITFDPETEGNQIKSALNFYQYKLKSVSFLPRTAVGAYKQMPYEAIEEKKYRSLIKKLKPIKFTGVRGEEAIIDKFCTNDTCEIM